MAHQKPDSDCSLMTSADLWHAARQSRANFAWKYDHGEITAEFWIFT